MPNTSNKHRGVGLGNIRNKVIDIDMNEFINLHSTSSIAVKMCSFAINDNFKVQK
jgi:hypothetical protein